MTGDVADTVARRDEAMPEIPDDALILLPVRGFVPFPGTVFPITVGRPRSVAAVEAAVRGERALGIVLQRDPAEEDPGPGGLHEIGCVCNVLRYMATPDGTRQLVCQGAERMRIGEALAETPFRVARVTRLPDTGDDRPEIEARLLHLRSQAGEVLDLLPQSPPGLAEAVQSMTEPGTLADLAAAYSDIPPDEKQEILETVDILARMEKVSAILARRIEVLKITREISQRTKEAFDDRQREAILREQLAAIRSELGDDDDRQAETADLTAAVAGAGMPEDVEAQVMKEIRRYERMPENAGEASMLRTWLDWMVELPWSLPAEAPIDIAAARAILDADHFGLEKVKTRIIEFLAVQRLAPAGKAPVLCFVGPPGVGKTSLGRSIAQAMKRPFVRVSLGGVHDEAEIRGHRRTYVGAMPGNIIQGIRRAGARDCVMMLDEIDKLGQGLQGDPSAALLEVLDPEQNATFRDNYLGVDFDLSRVVFLTTANLMDTIPRPLLDRMEVIALPGYTEEEKLEIAKRYLVARQREAVGLSEDQVSIDEGALAAIIRGYTREAGVRTLERRIGAVLRSAAVRIVEGRGDRIRIAEGDLHAILGAPPFHGEVAMRTALPGVATGLAWTPVGGDVLFIEATRAPGKGELVLTGQLGDVMRESARAALTLVKARAGDLGIDPGLFETSEIHIHVPAGATPKDGPSAGVSIFAALASLLMNRTVRSDTAMTGEISLRGLVLPVGGIKEKVIAAASAGVTRVLLPARNRHDFEEIPRSARDRLTFVWLETVDDVLDAALEPATGDAERRVG